MVKRSMYTITSITTVLFAVLLPVGIIAFAAWYFGFIFAETTNYVDPCLRRYTKDTCGKNKKCKWNSKSNTCSLNDKCSASSQQGCGEGCHWDATIKRPGSNLYGVCRQATLSSLGDEGTTELK